MIADAYLKGIRGYDAEGGAGGDGEPAPATGPTTASAQYMQLGYVPIDEEGEAASKTLEYAFDDWTIAQHGARRWDARRSPAQFMQARRQLDATPTTRTAASCARTAMRQRIPRAFRSRRQRLRQRLHRGQRLAVLLVRAAGRGRTGARRMAALEARARSWMRCSMRRSMPGLFAHMEDITGLIGWYAHGNEPSHHVAYLVRRTPGSPWRTQERVAADHGDAVRRAPDGLAGNDDLGQMSAWYVFTALGFYPVTPASN